jgi:SAM-dependent methyltransferase
MHDVADSLHLNLTSTNTLPIEVSAALLRIGEHLKENHYRFVTVTPVTHRIVIARSADHYKADTYQDTLRDFFGWNREVDKKLLSASLIELLSLVGSTIEQDGKIKCRLRFSTIGEEIFLHSGYPTDQKNSVFFGPDSYRFSRFILAKIKHAKSILDIGCGTGVGGISLLKQISMNTEARPRLFLSDINPLALAFAKINETLNGIKESHIFESDFLKNAPKKIDTLIANPPFVIDPKKLAYRNGGAQRGSEASLDIVIGAMNYLDCQTLALYTGTPIINGKDIFLSELVKVITKDFSFTYEELDPDIFGEELKHKVYHDVDRIAAVGLVLKRK